jgi:HEAT repeat protein
MISVFRATKLLAASTAWRLTGAEHAGRLLVDGLGAPDARTRAIAGILLARGGERAVPLIRKAIEQQKNLPQALLMAGGIGAKALEPELRRFMNHPDPNVARAASEGLRILAEPKKNGEGCTEPSGSATA